MTSARELFDEADLILLDFDGPVTRLLPPPSNAELASRAKDACLAAGVPLTTEEQRSTDHLSFIRAAGKYSEQALAAVESLCTQGEVAAATTSPVTPGIFDLLEASSRAGKTVIIVTNNSPECVEEFLNIHGMERCISKTIGRHPTKPEMMKPNPYILWEAMNRDYTKAILIGDSVSDIQAARKVDIPAIGLAKDQKRYRALLDTGAAEIIYRIKDINI